MSDQKFFVDYATRSTSKCKRCSQKLEKGTLRIAKLTENPFTDKGGEMKLYYHVDCLFDTFKRARATTKIIEEADDISNIETLKKEDKELLLQKIKEIEEFKNKKQASSKAMKRAASESKDSNKKAPSKCSSTSSESDTESLSVETESINVNALKFSEFCNLCEELAATSRHKDKIDLIKIFIRDKMLKKLDEGELYLLIKSLLPGTASNTVYNLNSKQLIKHFSIIFNADVDEMLEHLQKGDVSQTIKDYFMRSHYNNLKESTLTLKEVDECLNKLVNLTKENDQLLVLKKFAKKCTANDLKVFIRLIKKDLRINAGAKFILDGLTPNAYEAFKTSQDLRDVVHRSFQILNKTDLKKSLSIRICLMTPVSPMLAEPCRSVDFAFKRCPEGMFVEVKYDGERVQVHKRKNEFKFFSRSLKAVQPHKCKPFEGFLPQAFPSADDLIIDSEVLLVDKKTEKPLPFGTLGIHKKAAFSDACICLFVFDCLYINGRALLDVDIKKRREILETHMNEVKYHVMFSKQEFVSSRDHLLSLIKNAIDEGLEGLVLKPVQSIYEPGKRHWLKVKKDYLDEGSMADSADLVVLGAYYGTGSKGGIMSVFLMGCYDEDNDVWCTVTKVGNGLTDNELKDLQKGAFDMIKIRKNMALVPSWLNITRAYVPDFIVKDPKKSQVWEITGAEFTKAEAHTADGISIRFPRITRRRPDKDWKTATDLKYLQKLFNKSKVKPTEETVSAKDLKRKHSAARETHSAERTPKSKNAEPITSDDRTDVREKKNDKTKSFSKFIVNLPDIFKGVTFYIDPSIEEKIRDKLKRYIITYGGRIGTSPSDSNAHVIPTKDFKHFDDKQTKVFTVEEIWQSITEEKS